MAQENRRRGQRRAAARARPSALTATPAVGPDPRERLRTLGTLLVLAVAVSAAYAGAIHTPFIFDDRTAVVDNPSITRLWPPIGDAVTRGPLNPPPLAPTARRPLPNLTFALNYRFGGLEPTGYHVVNLVLHVLNAALLAALVRRTLRLPYFGMSDPVAWGLALAVALVWALHPLNSESVVCVTQRTELLGGLCYLGTLWAALRYWSAGSPGARRAWLWTAGLVCAAGMASKELVVSVPLAVLLYERTFLVDSFRATRRSRPLYASLAAGWILLFLLSFWGIGGLSDARHRIPLLVWWGTQTKILFLYLKLALWPDPLSIHYAPAYLWTVAAAWPWVIAAALLAAATLVLAWTRPAARFVVIVVVMVLGPTLAVPLPKMIAAERRMYLPLAGLIALALVAGYRALAARRPASVRLSIAALATLVVALGLATVRRVAAYDTAVGIWRDAVLNQPADAMSHYNLGVALLDENRPQEAIRAFESTLRIEPDHTKALDNLGMALERVGRPADAVAPLEEALRIDPDDAVAHNNLGSVLIAVGRAPEAITHLERALALMGDQPRAIVYANLGRALAATGRPEEALARLEEAGRLGPDDPEVQSVLADALLQAGQAERAVEHYRRAIARQPGEEALHNNLAIALLELGQMPDAVAELERAIRLKPDHADARFNLGRALLALDRPRDALVQLREAVRLDPADARARFECAQAYTRSGDPAAAIAMARDGLALARSHGQGALADQIEAWLGSQNGDAHAGDAR
jgi:tetratricopeptide (TPR) repeat protein